MAQQFPIQGFRATAYTRTGFSSIELFGVSEAKVVALARKNAVGRVLRVDVTDMFVTVDGCAHDGLYTDDAG